MKNIEVEKVVKPIWVVVVATILPGVGQVVNRMPIRGLVFIFYMFLLGIVTFNLTTPEHSLVGRYSGGMFIYAISILDAYKWASYRYHRTRAKRERPG